MVKVSSDFKEKMLSVVASELRPVRLGDSYVGSFAMTLAVASEVVLLGRVTLKLTRIGLCLSTTMPVGPTLWRVTLRTLSMVSVRVKLCVSLY